MQKTTVLVLMSLFTLLAAAQAPANKNKSGGGKTAAKSKMSPSEEATTAAQAAAIAQAAGQSPALSSWAAPASAPLAAAAMPAVQPGAAAPVAAPAALTKAWAPVPHDAPSGAVSSEELAIAQRVHQGQLPCEMGASIRVEPDAAQPGYFHLQGKGFRYRMRPVVTSTGAIRLEDAKAGAVWLQLANKSMLMDQKRGRRLADECTHPEQLAYAESMKTNPPPKLFDTTGMGR